MTETNLSDDELVKKFTDADHITAADIPGSIMKVLRYIHSNTGLTGDYNDGVVTLAEGGHTIQWYPRSRLFSSHDNLLTWLQRLENQDVILGQVGTRKHPETGETSGYIEIHETNRWIRGE